MITGKTSTGFEFSIPEDMFNDMELLDAMIGYDKGDVGCISSVCSHVLGDQKAALYDHVRTETGRVPIDAVAQEISEIVSSCKEAKKS